MITTLRSNPQAPGDRSYGETLPNELKLTNNEKYFELLVSPNSINVMITASDVVSWNFDTIMI